MEATTKERTTTGRSWSQRYGERHRLVRVVEFPGTSQAPQHVRVYRRRDHYILQWWDRQARQNLSDRVDGDLIDAVARARVIDQRLIEFRRSGCSRRRLNHPELVQAYLEDLQRRSDAGVLAVATVARYRAALRHLNDYIARPAVARRYSRVSRVDRELSLGFAAYLNEVTVGRNGHGNAATRRMQAVDFVLDTVRAMFAWAIDPQRGGLLPSDFGNPFVRSVVGRRSAADDMVREPDITVGMAADFLRACDDYQLRLFGPVVCFGLRPTELVFLFHEMLETDWLTVKSIPALDYSTKGKRDKRLPLLRSLAGLLDADGDQKGLVYVRRSAHNGKERPPLLGAELDDLADEYAHRQRRAGAATARDRLRIRNEVMRDAGALTYDRIADEFNRVARQLGWPRAATMKDFRHLFATAMANSGMSEHERRYLMGHAPGNGAIVKYNASEQAAATLPASPTAGNEAGDRDAGVKTP